MGQVDGGAGAAAERQAAAEAVTGAASGAAAGPALSRLPVAYALALQLRAAGLAGAELAARLGIEPEAVGPLLAVADAKLAALREAGTTGPEA